ncbi:EcsC family protein [Lapillicoccus sp.]|uniref:EcsC family protein n=1 Tax=Lapillicoccus sp. TaxID=1909287 RepID=UPI00398388AE
MGIFGFGDDDKGTSAKAAGGALSMAERQQEPRGLAGMATGLVERLLDTGIDGAGPLPSAQKVADSALSGAPDAEAAIDRVVRAHLAYAGAGGFLTGLGGFVTMPVALPANVLEFYLVATRMTAAVASLRGYDIRQGQIRTAVLLTLVGADADDLLKKAGVAATSHRLTNLAAGRLPGPALMVVNKAIGFRLVSQVGRSTFARLGKAVPVVGGAVGAGLDVYMLKKISDNARREFPPRALPTS